MAKEKAVGPEPAEEGAAVDAALAGLGQRWDDLLKANEALAKVWETESEGWLSAGLHHLLRVARRFTREVERVLEERER